MVSESDIMSEITGCSKHSLMNTHPVSCCSVLLQILTGKGVVSASDITAHIEELESYGGRGLGPRVIARAWSNPEFKKKLLEDGVAGVTELGMEAEGWLPYGGVTGESHSKECASCMHSVGAQQCAVPWLRGAALSQCSEYAACVALHCHNALSVQHAWCCTVAVH